MDDLEVDDLMIMDVPANQLVQSALEQRLNAVANATLILPCSVLHRHFLELVDTFLVAIHMPIVHLIL